MKPARLATIAFAAFLLTLGGIAADAQELLPEIRETFTNDFVPQRKDRESPLLMGSDRMGVQSLLDGAYRDSLVRRFDRIEEYVPEEKDTLAYRYFMAFFGRDTLCFKERRPVFSYDYNGKKMLEVESRQAPFQRFEVRIDGLGEPEVAALVDSLQRMKTSGTLMNNGQTCIFYALNLLLDRAGVDPAPVITRNTTFTDGYQLNAFFDHFLTLQATYPCEFRELKKVDLPENCVLVFRNAAGQYIHAVFYRGDTDEFYTKNGLFTPVVVKSIRPICERYGRTDSKADPDDGRRQTKADTVLVYTL